MDQVIIACFKAALSEIVPIAAISVLLRVLTERGIKRLGEEVAKKAIFRILRSLGSRIIPVLGLVWTAWLILRALSECGG